ncbi:unnamed protein product, partial [Meganyctiphanes norvegica]
MSKCLVKTIFTTVECYLFKSYHIVIPKVYTSPHLHISTSTHLVCVSADAGSPLHSAVLCSTSRLCFGRCRKSLAFRFKYHVRSTSGSLLECVIYKRLSAGDEYDIMTMILELLSDIFSLNRRQQLPDLIHHLILNKSPALPGTTWHSHQNIPVPGGKGSTPYHEIGVGVGCTGVSHTLGPLDGSLYATVSKKRSSHTPQPHSHHNPPHFPHSPLASPTAPLSPHAPTTATTPSPHGLANGRYAASIDSGIASTNSAGGAAPVSPPTSDSSRGSGDYRGRTAATVITTGRAPVAGGPGGAPLVDARQLDELLQGMLLDIQSIPDLRPSQTPVPDIDSIRCPDFSTSSMAPKADIPIPVTRAKTQETSFNHSSLHNSHHNHYTSYSAPPQAQSPVNGHSGSTTHDSLLDSSLSTTAEDLPYHARQDSKPFSYGAVTSSPLLGRRRTTSEGPGNGSDIAQPPPSPSIHRRNSRETLGTSRVGLESPRLVRKLSGSVGANPDDGDRSRRSPSRSPSPEPGSRGGTLQRKRSHTLTTRLMGGGSDREKTPDRESGLPRSEVSRSTSRLDDSFDTSYDPNLSSGGSSSNNQSWLQVQQRKLAERREAKIRAERAPHETRMLNELRNRINQPRTTTPNSRDFEDGYVSDGTLFSETSRESSPVKTLAPLTINTGVTPQKPPIGHSTPARGNSAPSSPILPVRSQVPNSMQSLPRKISDNSYDRERKFVSVKRSHENSKPNDIVDSSSALNQLQTSPLGHINYSLYSSASHEDGLLTTVGSSSNHEGLDSLDALSATLASLGSPILGGSAAPSSAPTMGDTTTASHSLGSGGSQSYSSSTTTTVAQSNINNLTCSPTNLTNSTTTTSAVAAVADMRYNPTAQTDQSRDESAWASDTESSFGGIRPITPGFPPSTPSTPYLNQGLPPKSPTMQRRALLGLSSLASRPTIRKAVSLPSKEAGFRSPSPGNSQTLRQELNGHSSPAPSLYQSQSRRSSLTSLNESAEIISSHPKFVKDISKFWYKPAISRDEAITMLRDKSPGTFVVRDSNSFPGAFGLALKVSTPPPNVSSKSSDPQSELVRHFLIEPTSRGVRLKGCANEPVFGSLSALVYQHSITALALPCRLVLPERDPAGPATDTVDGGTPGSASSATNTATNTQQLLQQGAACNVLYLYTAETESLTGPQAIKRAVMLMNTAKNNPTVVHFKVSAQGITLTDNERKLFFRRHYPVSTISFCGLDPDDKRWTQKNEEGAPIGSLRIFGFVAKKGASRTENQCHILAELEPEQPASAICNFVTKVMMTSVSRPNLV